MLIRGARQLLTLRGPNGPRRGVELLDVGLIPDGAVLIRDGLIEAVGPSRRLENLAGARQADVIDATGRVVMPAFTDLETSLVHAHPSPRNFERLLRNYGHPDPEVFRDVLDEGGRALANLSSQSLRRRALVVERGMIQYGTTTVESRPGYCLDETGALKVLRVQRDEGGHPVDLVSTLLLDLPAGGDAVRWTEWACNELLPKVRRRRLAEFINLEFDRNALPVPMALRITAAALQLGMGVKVHAGFFALSSAVPLAIRAGAVSVANLRWITPDERDTLAASSCIFVLKPGVALQTGMSSAAPGRELIDAGGIPALASGYHAELSPGYNMQLMMLLACRLYRLRPEEAINSATINSAYAVGAAKKVGSLEAGKQADLLILKVSDYHEVAYYAGVNIVEKTIRKGIVVYDSSDGTERLVDSFSDAE